MGYLSPSSPDSDSSVNLLFLVWGQWPPHSPWTGLWTSAPAPSRTREESWKEIINYLQLVLLKAKPSQISSLLKTTQWASGQQQQCHWVSRDQMTGITQSFPTLSFYIWSDKALIWEVCSLVKSSNLPEHFQLLFQGTGSYVCTVHHTPSVQYSQSFAS